MSEPTLLGTVPGGRGDPMRVYLLPGGGVTLNAGGVVFPVLAGELEGLAELLLRSAMPGQEEARTWPCCGHCTRRPCAGHPFPCADGCNGAEASHG